MIASKFTGRSGMIGKDLYSDEKNFEKTESDLRKEARTKIEKIFSKHKKQQIIDDIKEIGKIENSLCRSQFVIGVVEGNKQIDTMIMKIGKAMGFSNFQFYKDWLALKAEIGMEERVLGCILSPYRVKKGLDGRLMFDEIKRRHEEYQHSFALVQGYDTHEYFNLYRAKYPVLNTVFGQESTRNYIECIDKLIRGFYIINLVDLVMGPEFVSSLRSKQVKINKPLSWLESAVAKSQFKVLVVDDEPGLAKINSDLIRIEGFSNVDEVHSVEGAKQAINAKQYDLVVSDYRLDYKNDADKIYDFLAERKNMKRHVPDFVVCSGYGLNEMRNLAAKGVPTLEKVSDGSGFQEDLIDTVKGYYVMRVRELIGELVG